MEWTYPAGCGNDLQYFEVRFLESRNAEPLVLTKLNDIDFTHVKSNSFSGCYQVVGVDRMGNVGEPSEVCVDNCPKIFIRNVFTPNNDGLNDDFPGSGKSVALDPIKCPRFLQRLEIEIVDRWGKEVYYILWNDAARAGWGGKEKNGKELPAGI